MDCLVVSDDDGWMRRLVGVVVDCFLERAGARCRGISRRSGGSLVSGVARWWFDGKLEAQTHQKLLEVQVRLDRAAG